MTPPLRPGTPQDLDAAVDTLVAAFDDYPWTRHVIPEHDYTRRLRELQRLYLHHALNHGFVAVSERAEGVIALLPPDAPEPGEAVRDRIIALHGDRIGRLADTGRHGDPRDWGLETLAVHPHHQGGGLGGALIGFGLREAARRSAGGVRLETSEERNVGLYRRHGFRVVDRSHRSGGPPVWTMRAVPAADGGRDRQGRAAEAGSESRG